MPYQSIPELYVVETGDPIPQKFIHDDPIEEYLKSISDPDDFVPEEEEEHSSSIDPTNEYSEANTYIQGDKDSSINIQSLTKDAPESSIVAPKEQYPPIYMNHSIETKDDG